MCLRSHWISCVLYLVDPIHPHWPHSPALFRLGTGHSAGDLLDDDANEVALRFASNPHCSFVHVNENDVDVERGEYAIKLRHSGSDALPLLVGERVRVREDPPQRHIELV
jgi:hypothetical protein